MLSTRFSLTLVVIAIAAGCGPDVAPLSRAGARDLEPPRVLGSVGEGHVVDEPREVLGPPYPIILVHGFSGWDDVGPVEYFFGIKDMLEADGNDVTTPALPPYTGSDERALVLADVIDEVLRRTGKEKVHLIGHSQGGIDIRRVASHQGLDYASRIASITTISTPHDGTPVADLAEEAPDGVLNPAGQFLGWLLGNLEGEPPSDAAWANDDNSDAWDPDLAASIHTLTTSSMHDLRLRMPMPPEVPFFTVAGVSNLRSLDNAACAASLWERGDRVDAVDPLLLPTGTYLSFTDGGDVLEPTPNDGLVPVWSAREPTGTFLGCVPADHFDEIGQVADLGAGLVSGWDHRSLYRKLVENLRTVE
jgi:triacylglycerol lipase